MKKRSPPFVSKVYISFFVCCVGEVQARCMCMYVGEVGEVGYVWCVPVCEPPSSPPSSKPNVLDRLQSSTTFPFFK